MRIITGSAKGIRLKTLEGDATRPTSERVKEAIFSMLQMDIEGREVLDMFAGSGQMALEALSRGAYSAVLLDRSPAAIKIITENAEKTKLSGSCDIKKEDYNDYIKKNRGKRFDIVFIDPPYASGFYIPALTALLRYDMLKETSIIVCESGAPAVFSELSEKYSTIKQVKYGNVFVTLLTPNFSMKGNDNE